MASKAAAVARHHSPSDYYIYKNQCGHIVCCDIPKRSKVGQCMCVVTPSIHSKVTTLVLTNRQKPVLRRS